MGIPVKNVLYMEAMLDACFIPADDFISCLDGDFGSIQTDDERVPYTHILLDELDARRNETLRANEQHRQAFYWLACIGEAIYLALQKKDSTKQKRAHSDSRPMEARRDRISATSKEALVLKLKQRGVKFTVDGRLDIDVAIAVQRQYGVSTDALRAIGIKLI